VAPVERSLSASEEVPHPELDLSPGEERRRRPEVGARHCGHVGHVGAVEQVEGLGEDTERLITRDLEALLEPQVDVAVGLGPELVPRLGGVAQVDEAVAVEVPDAAGVERRPAAPEDDAGEVEAPGQRGQGVADEDVGRRLVRRAVVDLRVVVVAELCAYTMNAERPCAVKMASIGDR
jgi:hypothetical protein